MKNLILVAILCSIATLCDGQSGFNERCFKKAIEKIAKNYNEGKLNRNLFVQSKVFLYDSLKLDFLEKSDTLFILDSYCLETGTFYTKIWNSISGIEFTYQYKQGYKFERFFVERVCKLIQQWNTEQIIKESKQYPILPYMTIHVSMAIIHSCKIEIRYFNYPDFFNIDVERMEFRAN